MPTLPAIGPDAGNAQVSDNTYVSFTTGTNTLTIGLDDTPADFGTMSALSWQVEYNQTGRVDDTMALAIRIVNGATILAAADAGGTFSNVNTNVTNTTDTLSGVTAFAYVNTAANKATWDGASIEVRQTYTQSMGADGAFIRLDFIEFTGTYAGSTTVTVGTVTETESTDAVAVTTERTVAVGAASESEQAQAVAVASVVTVAVGEATESESAAAVSASFVVTVDTVTETETATATTPVTQSTVTVGTVTETESAGPVTVTNTVTVGLVTESETAHAIVADTPGAPQTISVGTVTESETATAVGAATDQTVSIGTPAEAETVSLVTVIAERIVTIATVSEAETAIPVDSIGNTIGRLSLAFAFTIPDLAPVTVLTVGALTGTFDTVNLDGVFAPVTTDGQFTTPSLTGNFDLTELDGIFELDDMGGTFQ